MSGSEKSATVDNAGREAAVVWADWLRRSYLRRHICGVIIWCVGVIVRGLSFQAWGFSSACSLNSPSWSARLHLQLPAKDAHSRLVRNCKLSACVGLIPFFTSNEHNDLNLPLANSRREETGPQIPITAGIKSRNKNRFNYHCFWFWFRLRGGCFQSSLVQQVVYVCKHNTVVHSCKHGHKDHELLPLLFFRK